MALSKDISNVLDEFGVKFTKDLQASLASKESWYKSSRIYGAIGQSAGSVINKDDSFILRFQIPNYYYWLDKSREPGNVNQTGQYSIKDWANRRSAKGGGTVLGRFIKYKKVKGDDVLRKKKLTFAKAEKQLAFLVARKIKSKGYKSKAEGFFTDVYTDGRLQVLSKELSRITGKDIVIQLTNDFK